MAFSSFTQSFRTGETDEKNLSSFAKFIPMVSKFSRSSRSSMSTCPDTPSADYDSHSEFSSTDAGDDISATYVDFDDIASTSSDGETSFDQKPPSPRFPEATAASCVYSVMMLLRLRAAVCDDDDDTTVRYSARCASDLPTPSTPKAKSASRPRAFGASTAATADTWRSSTLGEPSRSEADTADSWRQALPESTLESWVIQQRKRDAQDDDDNVVRAARSILNKLTVEKFDSLFEQLATCGIKKPHHISILMREVFEKATTQHHFIPMYAELCVKLEKDPRIAAAVEEADLPNNFRRLLLNQCQNVFEQLLESCSTEADADEEMKFRRKQQALGNMKLIGQLLVNGMLSSDLFPECCEALLRKRSQCPEALESLVALMMVAGPKFDSSGWQYYQRLEKILMDMGALTKEKSVPPRLRFLIRDVLDARAAGWPSSRRGKTPTTLEEVRNAASVPEQKEETVESCSSPVTEGAKGNSQGLEERASPKAGKKKVVKFAFKDAAATATPAEVAPTPKQDFEVITFRRALASIFADLASEKNIPAAVQRVRAEQVPPAFQADQFVDMLTRTVEERRGAVRRCELAFLAGLAAAEESAFDRKECLAGIGRFFNEVYPELCNEVHRLPAIMKSEFMPTVANVFPKDELNKVVPGTMRK